MQVYDYDLPEEKIAKYPLERRDASRLLVYKGGTIADAMFRDIAGLLPPGALLVRNDTRVIRARLRFRKATGAPVEIFCLEPQAPADAERAFAQREAVVWQCIVGNSKRWKEGALEVAVETPAGRRTLRAERLSNNGATSDVRFSWDGGATFADVIEAAGVIPIPPYLNRETESIDDTRYQTVYSLHKGSVAAPTAGLHFTPEVLGDIERRGHETVSVTLHVGAGTFKPITTDNAEDHTMHTEHIVVSRDAIEKLIGRDVVAVGTTSVRTLESLYWLGVKVMAGVPTDGGLGQWEAYRLPQDVPAADALRHLADHLRAAGQEELRSQTQIMIVPGYRFRVVNALITNFHQPHSTLLLLIGAFVGLDWRRIYDHALASGYRFLSYGDSSLLMP